MTTKAQIPLVARIDFRARLVRCASPSCAATITRLVHGQPAFSGEWRERDDKVWRLTDYARYRRRRREDGLTAPPAYRRSWTEPASWGLVVRAEPCVVECPECGARQIIA